MLPKIGRFRNLIWSVDRNGLIWITEFRHPYLNRTMEVFSRAGDWEPWTAILTTMAIIPGGPRRTARFVVPRVLSALTLCYTLKRFAKRSRPSVAVEGFSTLLIDPDPYSFPSSHSACSWAAAVSTARVLGGAAWFLTFYAALISYSRIHVGAHYPLDVVVGSLVGTLIGQWGKPVALPVATA